MENAVHNDDDKVKEWLAVREREALKIDPKTAEATWSYAATQDPYGVYPEMPIECIGREYFARRPGGDIWVWFGDLPDGIREKVWERADGEGSSREYFLGDDFLL